MVDESEKAKMFLFGGMTGILILVMIIFATALTFKIRRLDNQIE